MSVRKFKRKRNGKKKKGKMVRIDFMTQKIIQRWPLGGFPEEYTAKLRYVQEFPLDTGAGTNSVKTFRASGIFDPDFSIGGHQPLGSDELYAIYNTSVVMGAKATVTWITSDFINVVPGLIIGFKNKINGALSLFSLEDILEQTNRTGYLLGGVINSNINGNNTTVTMTYSPEKDLGVVNPTDDDLLRGSILAGPITEYFFEVYSLSIAGNNPGNLNFIIEIDYLCKFFDRKAVAGS